MNKRLILVLLTLGLTSCTTKDESYYLAHPKELQQALSACPHKKPNGVSCEQVEILGKKLNQLGAQLQSSPQGFGKIILELQETIAKQDLELKKNPGDAALKAALLQNKSKLTEHLAAVKWLESPES